MNAQDVIRKLGLEKLPLEGGYYRQTYKSEFSTAIYYLVTPEDFSALHKLTNDEVFHFYGGDPVEMIQINEGGKLSQLTLGSDILKGQLVQTVVSKNTWQGARLAPGGEWALVGATCAPAFDFKNFELGERALMLKLYPQHKVEIEKYTRP